VTQTFEPGYCRVIVWTIFLEKVDPIATVPVSVTRRYAWWTKNMATRDVVHQMGEVIMSCGTIELTFTCKIPLAFHSHECQTACSDPECALIPTGEIGFQAPLPAGLHPPEGWEPRYPGKILPSDEPADDGATGEEPEDDGTSSGEPSSGAAPDDGATTGEPSSDGSTVDGTTDGTGTEGDAPAASDEPESSGN
jgi:hypothetical protein